MKAILYALFQLFAMAACQSLPHVQIQCALFDLDKNILYNRSDSGLCLFLDDGTIILSENGETVKRGRANEELWRKKFVTHHMLTLAKDDSLLALGSEDVASPTGLRRFDEILKIDVKSGQIVKAFHFALHMKRLIELAGPYFPTPQAESSDWLAWTKAKNEFTHANSIYEIPGNPLSQTLPAFQAGNWIVNINTLGLIVIVDKNLDQPLWALHYLPPHDHRLHDVQVLANGHLLLFNNHVSMAPPFVSGLDEYDVLKKEIVWRFQPKDPKQLASEIVGSVQKLPNGNIFYSDITAGGYARELDQAGRTVWSMPHWMKSETTGLPLAFQDAKRLNAQKFLLLHRRHGDGVDSLVAQVSQ